jgi:hypothetical protein
VSLMDKLKSIFSGGSPDTADAHAGHDHAEHDHAEHDHSHEPATPPLPAADLTEMPASEEGDTTPD